MRRSVHLLELSFICDFQKLRFELDSIGLKLVAMPTNWPSRDWIRASARELRVGIDYLGNKNGMTSSLIDTPSNYNKLYTFSVLSFQKDSSKPRT